MQEVLTWIITLLKQAKSYFDDNLNHTKVRFIDLTKDNSKKF